jgi:hypothetical protein
MKYGTQEWNVLPLFNGLIAALTEGFLGVRAAAVRPFLTILAFSCADEITISHSSSRTSLFASSSVYGWAVSSLLFSSEPQGLARRAFL